ncbi:MAG: hypothetical protein JSV25_03180 [Spirochaetota bacterium]|nr:MAG: hypothetical protein JSV25_03180 [Spirochaetota bacterium]
MGRVRDSNRGETERAWPGRIHTGKEDVECARSKGSNSVKKVCWGAYFQRSGGKARDILDELLEKYLDQSPILFDEQQKYCSSVLLFLDKKDFGSLSGSVGLLIYSKLCWMLEEDLSIILR